MKKFVNLFFNPWATAEPQIMYCVLAVEASELSHEKMSKLYYVSKMANFVFQYYHLPKEQL